MQEGPSEVSGLQRLLVMFEGEPFEETCAQSSLGAGGLWRAGRFSPISLVNFTSSINRKWSSGKLRNGVLPQLRRLPHKHCDSWALIPCWASGINLVTDTKKKKKRKTEMGSLRAEPGACRPKRARFSCFSMTMEASMVSWVLPPSFGKGFCLS